MLAQVRAVAFDLDNTLWDVNPVIERAELRLYEWLHQHCPRIPQRVSIEDMRAARELLAREEPHNAHDFTYLRLTGLVRHARECGYDDEVARRAFDVFFAARNELDVFADVRPALARLRARYVLATLSNGNADLARIGLADLFSLSLNARQIGVGKPHPRCFERLAVDLRVAPAEIVYVGDDPVLDVAAARAAGLLTAWVNRFGQRWPDTIAPADIVVTNCTQLADALGVVDSA
ncbi:MAG TPA: HAD family hydrolase [Steroidobacteraceae bacterium]|nr:HAD family hydrolase [Steroidobacteraceae bacterium]